MLLIVFTTCLLYIVTISSNSFSRFLKINHVVYGFFFLPLPQFHIKNVDRCSNIFLIFVSFRLDYWNAWFASGKVSTLRPPSSVRSTTTLLVFYIVAIIKSKLKFYMSFCRSLLIFCILLKIPLIMYCMSLNVLSYLPICFY